MSNCPSCGCHAGPYEACPYCGARLTGRTPIRVVKIAAILLATVGLVALWFAATRAEVPLIQIGQAGATMNMAYVRIQGRCTREPSYDPESDYLSFWLADETGTNVLDADNLVMADGVLHFTLTVDGEDELWRLSADVAEPVRLFDNVQSLTSVPVGGNAVVYFTADDTL